MIKDGLQGEMQDIDEHLAGGSSLRNAEEGKEVKIRKALNSDSRGGT